MISTVLCHVGKTPFTLAQAPHDKKSPGKMNLRGKVAGGQSQECAIFTSLTFCCSGPGQGVPSCKCHPLQETRILPEN